jgi:hypothetical protein
MNAQLREPLPDGFLLDVPAEAYHRRELGVANNTALKILRERSPAHYRAWVDGQEQPESPAFLFGRAYHCRVLEPERFAREFIAEPADAPARPTTVMREAKKPSPSSIARVAFWDQWDAANAGKTVISADDYARIEAMHAALMAQPLVAGIMRDGFSEVTMRWVDEPTGIACKARADWWVPGRFFMDLKTTDDASPKWFARAIADYGYHVQHAHYCDAARACGQPVRNYLILAQEKEPPYVAAVYHIDAEAEARGFELRERGLQVLRNCLDTNTWPGYGSGITEISLPGWALKD